MRVLITGARGMLAQAVLAELAARGDEAFAFDRSELDITDAHAVRRTVGEVRPDAVVQCAAYTRVDDAETERDLAFAVNARGTELVAAACEQVGAMFVYPSTDYVFSGTARSSYPPGHPVAPVNEYGRTKLAGEQAALRYGKAAVVRTSWLYGAGGPSFVATITRLGRERDQLQVVDDQIGRPTWTGSLAHAICGIADKGAAGVFHVTDGGQPTSWFGFATAILQLQGISTPVVPVSSDRFPRPAARPAYSVLDCSETEALLGFALPDWRRVLADYLAGRPVQGAGVGEA